VRSVRGSVDVVPIGQFKARTTYWLERLGGTKRPMVITQKGRPAGVLMSPSEFDRLQDRERFLEDVAAGLADANAGRTVTTAELRKSLGIERARRRSSRR